MDQIHSSISSWILTTAIDFNLHKDALFGINQYALKVKQSITRYSESFQSDNPRYSLLNMTMVDINLVLHKITSAQIETLNLINNVHGPKDFRTKRSLLPCGRLFHFLFRTAKHKEVKSMKQDIKRLYDNQITQSKVLNDVISIANILRGFENILKINQIISTITFLNDMMDSIMNKLKPLFSARRFLLLHTGMHFTLAYLDDVIIFSKSAEQHLKYIQIVLTRLKQAKLWLKRSKCLFFKQELHYLGHLMTMKVIKPVREGTIYLWDEASQEPEGLREFLGMVGYYQKFINRFADAARPMTKLTRKVVKFEWTEECQTGFEYLKACLTEAPILKYPDPSKRYVVFTDASEWGSPGIG